MDTAAHPSNGSSPALTASPASTASAPPKRRRRPFLILGIIAVLAVAGIGLYTMATEGREGTDDAQVAADMVPIATRVAGAVTRLHIHENQLVKRGDLLVEIDPADYEARVQQAEAELSIGKAQARLGYSPQVKLDDGVRLTADWYSTTNEERPGAPVSTPLLWEEVNSDLHPSQFTMMNAPGRFADKGDLFAGVLNKRQRLEKAFGNLEKLLKR